MPTTGPVAPADHPSRLPAARRLSRLWRRSAKSDERMAIMALPFLSKNHAELEQQRDEEILRHLAADTAHFLTPADNGDMGLPSLLEPFAQKPPDGRILGRM